MTYRPPEPQAVIASFVASYTRKVLLRRQRHMRKNFGPLKVDKPTQVFREVLLEHVSYYTPRTSGEIKRRLEDDYGSVKYRRLWRHLTKLTRDGVLVRTPDGYLLARRAV